MVSRDSDTVPGAEKQIDRLVIPLFALLLILGVVSFVSIFTDHVQPINMLTGQVIGYGGFDDSPIYLEETSYDPPFELKEVGPNKVAAGGHILINLFGNNIGTGNGLVTVNIYNKPYWGGHIVMQFKSAVHTTHHASFWLPSELEPGNYFISVGEGNKESSRQEITLV